MNGKLKFEYHKQSLEYVEGILDGYGNARKIDPIDREDIDPNRLPSFRIVEPRAGFEPATPALPRRSPTGLGYRGVDSPLKRIP